MSSGAAAVASNVNRNNRRRASQRDLRGSRRDLRDSPRENSDFGHSSGAADSSVSQVSASDGKSSTNVGVLGEEHRTEEQHPKGSTARAQDRDLNGVATSISRDEGNVNEPDSDGGKGCHHSLLQCLYRGRNLCGRIVNNNQVQLVIILLISINAIMMGIGTFDFVLDDPAIEAAFEKTDEVFLIIFTVELVMQFIYHGHRLFLDGWLVFDFVVVVMSWSFSQVQIIRAFRIFRALRLVTRVAVMRNLVTALFSVIPRMAAICLLLVLIMYIFAVMFTQLFKYMFRDGLTEYDYFSNLGATFFTLFQIMTLDAWADVARDVMATYTWAWLPFVVFVIISGFIIVNLIIAVICDAISSLQDDEKAALLGTATEAPETKGEKEAEEEEIECNDEDPSSSAEEEQKLQIEALENQIVELTKVQQDTMKTIEVLTQHLKRSALVRAQL
uniref:Ion transport domain-containing protein n=1 Tax=Odontella aurita TaxID=265563 RepID=A0A7S4J5U9_9STRA|mmetsp:Transcript_39469/g.118479  ORF Transcript_39469/g.118479 Transcript_39469/m.118479 type:complete len:444 (+) Transcript_39469:214-1545(+)|eukprot:CAMPEP_0113575884 /NCGR_PEP_ID=MMETSP0015_2-20120614/27960_1 /TAXON_ID=2838 /ORGANISM="Odontella" /LENGTH=443 /DNA_ID=CAMNT_0000479201 /DNA_START=144 /DNA_END=1475 /DNA_ORIENTATION=+ /assembly_acc=CAM_ASM_000160